MIIIQRNYLYKEIYKMHTDFLRKTKKNALLLLLASAMALSGCGNGADASEDITVAESGSASESTAASEISSDTEASSETYLPDGMTMDDLRNMVQINGKTLTMPTSLNKITELDDKFSYEAEYVDENSPLYNGEQTGFYVDIMYNNVFMFTTSFAADENDISKISDCEIASVTFNKKRCQSAGLSINTSCGLGFDSSKENVNEIFGIPNDFDYSESNMRYKFNADEYEVKLFIDIYEKNNTVSSISVNCTKSR